MDCIVAIPVCPCDIPEIPVNGDKPTPLKVEVYEAAYREEPAIDWQV